ncbi:type II toxin-antitoxin system VapC family toxin [Rhizobium rhizophilum]|uniref:type II toxin-antitoxin system VapC family toxin n=1 Tax=Rhizobium rhizophilum TaxID=1850373 RepID=UPI001F2B6178|nr:type II toxin-antitoxin system VapC family toxin [Rhizobium rhizophilum]
MEILTDAPRRQDLLDRMANSPTPFSTSATVIYETTVVISSRTAKTVEEAFDFVEEFLAELKAEILRDTALCALDAFSRYGKGRHPARLNFGDCFSYAGAKASGAALLYVGEDFRRTDLA